MLDQTELHRLAAMGHALRPDWPVPSLLTILGSDVRAMAYRDVAVALAWIACDAATQTPKRLREAGPWWQATATGRATSTPVAHCPKHPDQPVHCPICLDGIEDPAIGAARVKAALLAARRGDLDAADDDD